MEQLLICMSLSLIAGLLASRAAKAVRLPAVTSYLVAGLLLGPFFLGRLGLSGWGFGFGSLAQVESYGIITQVALGFIAFVIGNEFRLSALKHMGRRAVTVGIAQAVLGDPEVIILDEPTVGLDPAQVIEIRRLIRELGKSHTVILSSHILSEVKAVCDKALILSQGHLAAVVDLTEEQRDLEELFLALTAPEAASDKKED